MISYGVASIPRRSTSSRDEHGNCLLIAGMHRSGTSALTRVLNLHGVGLGSSLLEGNSANERGFWEHADFMVFNDRLLAQLGRRWDDPGRLPDGWWQGTNIGAFAAELTALVTREFSDAQLWGAKDPRLCRLLPLWQQVLAGLGVGTRYVLPLRNPYEVADSLSRRDGSTRSRALVLWLRHVLEAERHTRAAIRVFTSYEQLLSDWRGTVARISQALELPLPRSSEQVAVEVDAFLTPALRHHRVPESESIPRWLRTLVDEVYAHLLEVANSGRSADAMLLDRAAVELNELEDAFSGVLPVPAQRAAVGVAGSEEGAIAYPDWVEIFGLHESDAQLMAERMVLSWRTRPSVHLVVPLGDDQSGMLAPTLESLSGQLYTGWGLTVVSKEPCPAGLFDGLPNLQWWQAMADPESVLNEVITETETDWVAFLRPGDRLAPDALFACLDHLQRSPDWTLIYTDEDRLDSAGNRADPWFKTDADPDRLRSHDCVGGFCLVRRDVLLASGGCSAQPAVRSYDLALKALDHCGVTGIGHVTGVLYHRGPVAEALHGDGHVSEWHAQALASHLQRCGETGEIAEGLTPHSLRVRYGHSARPKVSIVIPVRDDLHALETCLDSLRATTSYPDTELVLVDQGSEAEDTYDYLDSLHQQGIARVLTGPDTNSRAAACNAAAEAAQGDFLVFIDHRVIFVQDDWLDQLVAHAQRPDVGAVGPRVVGPDQTVVHSALVLGLGGVAGDAFSGLSVWDAGYAGRALIDQGVSALPNVCLVVRRALFDVLGGFDEDDLPDNWYHLDFCLRLRDRGLRAVWTPHTLLGWQPKHGPAHGQPGSGEEEDRILQRWIRNLARDPYYNRNLSLSHRDYRPRIESTANWDPDVDDRPRVLGIPADTYGCGEYRVLGPLKALADGALARCGFTTPQEGQPKVPSVVELERLAPDSLLLQATLYDPHLHALERYKRFSGAFRVFDMEDLKTEVPVKNSRRKTLLRDIKSRTRRALGCCDRLLVTTEPLADVYRSMVDDIRVVPNYLPGARWAGLQSLRRQGSRPRVGWAGAQQHEGDLELLIPVVEATAKEVDWIFFGMCPEPLRPYAREVHPFGPFEEYPGRLASLNLDLAVAPLEHHPFNVAKSNLRILEYGVLGWPVVCTDIEPYRGAPVARVPNDPAAWVAAIRERIHDLDATEAEGDRLRDWVLGRWMLEDHLNDWLAALQPGDSRRVNVA